MSKSRPLHIIEFHYDLAAIKFMPVLVVYIFRLIMKQMLNQIGVEFPTESNEIVFNIVSLISCMKIRLKKTIFTTEY